MAYKGQSGLHPSLKNMARFNEITCLYEATENGITYGMPFSEFQFFKKYFQQSGTMVKNDSVLQWYNQLSKQDKKTITFTGNKKAEADGWLLP